MALPERTHHSNRFYSASFLVGTLALGVLTAGLFYLPQLQSAHASYGLLLLKNVQREKAVIERVSQIAAGVRSGAIHVDADTSRRLSQAAAQLGEWHVQPVERGRWIGLYDLPHADVLDWYQREPGALDARMRRYLDGIRSLAGTPAGREADPGTLSFLIEESSSSRLPSVLGELAERCQGGCERIQLASQRLMYAIVLAGWGILAWMFFGILRPLLNRLARGNAEHTRVNSMLVEEIARRMRTESALAQQREEQRVIFDAVPAMIWYKNGDNRILRANRLAAASIGRRVDEVEGHDTAEFYPEEADKYLKDDREVIRTGQPKMGYLEIYPALEGPKRWVETYKLPYRDDQGRIVGVVVFAIDVTERKQAEEALKSMNETLEGKVQERTRLIEEQSARLAASEENLRRQTSILRSVLNSMSDGVVVADESQRFILWNDAASRIVGVDMATGHPGKWAANFGLFLPDRVTPAPEEDLPLVRAIRGEETNDVELFIRNANYPEGIFVSCSARPLRMEDGSLRGGVVVFRDVTPHKQADEAIRQIQRQQQAILNNIPDIAWLKDGESRFIMVNEPFAKTCGVPAKEVTGKSDFDFWPAELAELYRADDREVMRTGRHKLIEEPLVDSKGNRTWIETIKAPVYGEGGRVVGTTGIAREITQRKLIEDALRESREYLDKIINSVADPIFVKDRQHRWVLLNDSMCRFFGHPRDQLLGRSDYEFFPKNEADVFWEKDELVFTSAKENTNEEYFTDAAGVRHTILTRKSLYVDKQGQPYIVGVIRDITELKAAQQEVLAKAAEVAQLNAEREQLELFAFVASHDLQEPLQKIIGFGDLLRLHLSSTIDEKSRQYLERVQEAARRLSRLIDDLFAFSKVTLDQQEMEPIELSDVLKDVLQDLDHRITEKRARVDVHKLPRVQADRVQMYELFKNLIANALKFSKPDLPPHVMIRSETKGRTLHVQVIDNGIGFDDKYREQIFRPFERLHRRDQFDGSGIGLAICQKIALRHRGSIQAEGRPGRGSTFTVSLPVTA